jgi:hypothetical protein
MTDELGELLKNAAVVSIHGEEGGETILYNKNEDEKHEEKTFDEWAQIELDRKRNQKMTHEEYLEEKRRRIDDLINYKQLSSVI